MIQPGALRIRVLLLLAAPSLASAAEQWIKLVTPHFELYTTAGDKKGREAILYFEQVRSFFAQAFPSRRVSDFPVRIVAFRSEKQYQPYRANDFAMAYYARNQSRDYIVMQDITSEHYPVAIHEYTHLVIENMGLHLPAWLNEGWADLFSTLKAKGDKAMIGEVVPGRARVLLEGKWLDLNVLGSVDHDSPLYSERNKASLFYAESWALTHMLYLAPAYRPNFTKLVLALNAHKSMAEACQTVLGKDVAEVQADLQAYLRSDRLYAAVFPVKLEKSAEEAVVSNVTAFESEMAEADLLALVRKRAEAKRVYERLAQEDPSRPEVEESLGYLEWRTGDENAARRHFAKALAAGTKNPLMCFHYAMLEHDSGAPGSVVIPALRRAVELKPDYRDARLQLGLNLLGEKEFSAALHELQQVKTVTEEQASWFYSGLAMAFLETGDEDQARKNAESAKKWARSAEERDQADSLLRYLDSKKGAARD